MRSGIRRGTVLVTAMFVVLVVHALVAVMLASLRANTGHLKSSDLRQQASLKAHSAALFALDQLQAADGAVWESQHTIAKRTGTMKPPAQAALIESAPDEDVQLQARAWVEETDDPDLRTVWGACFDGSQWNYSTAVAVRREVNPGILFGVRKGLLVDEFYFRPLNGDQQWVRAPGHPSLTNTVYDCSASRDGKLFILQSDKSDPDSGLSLKVAVLDTKVGSNGTWSDLPTLPSDFFADPTGLAVGKDELYVSGMNAGPKTPTILRLPLTGSGDWQRMVTLPQAIEVDARGKKTLTTFPFQLTDLKAGPEGELYLQMQLKPGPGKVVNSFARFQDGSWSFFPKPPDLKGATRRNLLPIEVDDLGNVLTFGLPNEDEPGQIYRFAPTGQVNGGVVQGNWKTLPTDATIAAQEELRVITVDSEGNLFAGVREMETSGWAFQELKQLPLRGSQSTMLENLSFPAHSMHMVEAGGQGPTGGLEYVPVSWY